MALYCFKTWQKQSAIFNLNWPPFPVNELRVKRLRFSEICSLELLSILILRIYDRYIFVYICKRVSWFCCYLLAKLVVVPWMLKMLLVLLEEGDFFGSNLRAIWLTFMQLTLCDNLASTFEASYFLVLHNTNWINSMLRNPRRIALN